jgi:hypothetical protein
MNASQPQGHLTCPFTGPKTLKKHDKSDFSLDLDLDVADSACRVDRPSAQIVAICRARRAALATRSLLVFRQAEVDQPLAGGELI